MKYWRSSSNRKARRSSSAEACGTRLYGPCAIGSSVQLTSRSTLCESAGSSATSAFSSRGPSMCSAFVHDQLRRWLQAQKGSWRGNQLPGPHDLSDILRPADDSLVNPGVMIVRPEIHDLLRLQ